MPLLKFNLHRMALCLIVLGVVSLVSAVTAKADQVTVTGVNSPVSATVNIISLTNGSITFSVTNNVVAGFSSTITGIGFALPGTITANSPGACGPTLAECNNFSLTPTVTNSPGNVPNFPSAVLDWAVITGPQFTGGNPPGVDDGFTATFTVTGNFAGLTQEQFLAGVYVRFQSIDCPPQTECVGSDVAHDPGDPVPEPASMLLLGSGLLGVATRIRRRHQRSKE